MTNPAPEQSVTISLPATATAPGQAPGEPASIVPGESDYQD